MEADAARTQADSPGAVQGTDIALCIVGGKGRCNPRARFSHRCPKRVQGQTLRSPDESCSDRRIAKRNDLRVIICNGVDVVDVVIRRIIHVILVFVASEKSPATIVRISRLAAIPVADLLAMNCNLSLAIAPPCPRAKGRISSAESRNFFFKPRSLFAKGWVRAV